MNLKTGLLLASVFGLFTLVPVASPATAPDSAVSPELALEASEDCILMCWDEFGCPHGWHDAWWVGPEEGRADYGDGYHSLSNPCWEGTCSEKHPWCISGGGSHHLADLRRGIADEDADLVQAAIVAMGPASTVLVRERSALQILGCDERVIVHLTLSADLIQRLAE